MNKKNTSNIFLFSLAAVLGLVTVGCSAYNDNTPKEESSTPSVIDDDIETSDEIGTKLAIVPTTVAQNQISIADGFGYQVLNETASTISVRIVATLNGFKDLTKASVTSKVVSPRDSKDTAKEDETVIKAEQTFDVTSVYSSLYNASEIKWTSEPDATTFSKKYYIIYTLKNIPVEHAFDTISVTFSATSKEETKQTFTFNAYGVKGVDSRFSFTEIGDTNSYYIDDNSTSLEGVIAIPSYHYTVSDYYAVKDGDVTQIGKPSATGSSSGGFASLSKVTEYILPETITSINAYSFWNNTNLKKINLPASLTTIGSSAFNSVALDYLDYSATTLVNSKSLSLTAKNITVSKNVTSLPNEFFASGNIIENLTFGGTEEKWEGLKNTQNQYNGFFSFDAICSDTSYSKVTFHYGEGKIGEATGDKEVTARNNRLLDNPGSPVLSGKEFKGWFTDEKGNTAFDFATTKVTGAMDLYAIYDEPSDGYSKEKPLVVTPSSATSFNAELYPGKEYEWIKLEIPSSVTQGDWYYFSVDRNSCVVNKGISTDTETSVYSLGELTVLDKNGDTVTSATNFSVSSDAKVQYNSYSYKNAVRVFANGGDTYYIKARMSTGASGALYGTIALSFATYSNDTTDEAIALTLGTTQTCANIVDSDKHKLIYSFKPSKDGVYSISKADTGKTSISVSFAVYDATTKKQVLSDTSYSNELVLGNLVSSDTYYIEVKSRLANSEITDESWFSITINEVFGYTKDSAIEYKIGETATTKFVVQKGLNGNNNEAGAYYSFTIEKASVFKLTAGVGNSSCKRKISILKTDDSSSTDYGFVDYSVGSKYEKTQDVTLEAGNYIMSVGYCAQYSTSTVSSYNCTNYTFSLVEYAEGDHVKKPKAIEPTAGTPISLEYTSSGKYYSFVAKEDGYVRIEMTNDISCTLYEDGNQKDYSNSKRFFAYKVTKDSTYVIKLSKYGSSETANITFTYGSSVVTGNDFATAVEVTETDLVDLMPYVYSSSLSPFHLKFTPTQTTTYKMFFQSSLSTSTATSYDGADTSIKNVIGNGNNYLTYIVKNDNDAGAHTETKGNKSAYAEFALTAGTTYDIMVALPASDNTKFDSLSFGVKAKTAGESYDVSNDLGEVTSTTTTLTAKGSKAGYWSKFTLTNNDELTVSAPALGTGTSSIAIYNASDLTNSVISLTTGSSEGASAKLKAGAYYVCVINDADAAEADVTLNLTHKEIVIPKFSGKAYRGSYSYVPYYTYTYHFYMIFNDELDSSDWKVSSSSSNSATVTTDGSYLRANNVSYEYTNGDTITVSFTASSYKLTFTYDETSDTFTCTNDADSSHKTSGMKLTCVS